MWKVVPLCNRQLLDVEPNDILNNGLYRKCNTYKSGGGYDKLPEILEKRKMTGYSNQFVVQLKGCNFKCPYCYVTEDGINGECTNISTEKIINDFIDSKCDIFHLMGGNPALYMNEWYKIIKHIPNNKIFHSDMLLIEEEYKLNYLNTLANKNTIYAVSIKGANKEEYLNNTKTNVDFDMILENLFKLSLSYVNFYVTFTGMTEESIQLFKNEYSKRYLTNPFKDSFAIKLIEYNAI